MGSFESFNVAANDAVQAGARNLYAESEAEFKNNSSKSDAKEEIGNNDMQRTIDQILKNDDPFAKPSESQAIQRKGSDCQSARQLDETWNGKPSAKPPKPGSAEDFNRRWYGPKPAKPSMADELTEHWNNPKPQTPKPHKPAKK